MSALLPLGPLGSIVLTLVTSVAGGLIGWLVTMRVLVASERRALSIVDWFTLALTAALFGVVLSYPQFADSTC